MLNEDHQASPGLERRILANLPATDALQRLFDWVAASFARAAVTAAMPLVLGFAIGFDQDHSTTEFDEDVITLAFAATFEEFDHE